MNKFEEELKETYEKVSINLYGNNAGSIGMKKLLNELKDTGLLKEQQALPVVPECVAEFIEDCKKEGDCLFGVFADATRVEHDMPDLVYFWLGDEGNNDELFARAWLDGYTVEKPQLFYLKEKNFGYYIANEEMPGVDSPTCMYIENAEKFTQAEIDSMQTGSYEQIKVEEEK